jgi:hypothetical protein
MVTWSSASWVLSPSRSIQSWVIRPFVYTRRVYRSVSRFAVTIGVLAPV